MKTLQSIMISFQETSRQAQRLEDCADNIRSIERQIDEIMADVRNNWSGEAAALYLDKCEQLKSKVSKTGRDLNQIANSIQRAAKQYRDAEETAIRLAAERGYSRK